LRIIKDIGRHVTSFRSWFPIIILKDSQLYHGTEFTSYV